MELEGCVWNAVEIAVGGKLLTARVCSFDSPMVCDELLERRKREVVAAGGALFLHVKKPPLVEDHTPGDSPVGYRYAGPLISELWHVASCTFGELLDASRFFGFPSRMYVHDPKSTFDETCSFLMEFHQRKVLAITQIEDSHISLELMNTKDQLEDSEAARIIKFNQKHFDVRESLTEEREKKRSWMRTRSFTVGAI